MSFLTTSAAALRLHTHLHIDLYKLHIRMHGPAQPQPVHGASHCPVLCDRTCQHANHARICHCCCCRTYNRLPHNTPPRHEELASGRPQTISQLGSHSAIPCSTGSITLQQSTLYNYLTTYKPRSCCAIQTPLKQGSSYAPASTLPCRTPPPNTGQTKASTPGEAVSCSESCLVHTPTMHVGNALAPHEPQP